MLVYLIGFLCVQQIANAQQYQQNQPYLGTFIGKFNNHLHGVSGDVYAVDENTIYIQNFNYDGEGPDAYFWMGSTSKPDGTGIIIPDEKGATKPLAAYKNKNLVLRLPEGKRIRDIKWISVWCRKFSANFADLNIPRRLEVPSPVEISALSQLDHGVKSGPITIVDAQTFLIPDFHYDGQGPAGYWWATRGRKQGPSGTHLNDENGTQKPLRRYAGETVVISLPDGKTIWDYDFLGVWCQQFNVDFGHTKIPQNVKVPPSPRMLGIMPEVRANTNRSPSAVLPRSNRVFGQRIGGVTRANRGGPVRAAVNPPQPSGTASPQHSGAAFPQYNGAASPQYRRVAPPQYSRAESPRHFGAVPPRTGGVTRSPLGVSRAVPTRRVVPTQPSGYYNNFQYQ